MLIFEIFLLLLFLSFFFSCLLLFFFFLHVQVDKVEDKSEDLRIEVVSTPLMSSGTGKFDVISDQRRYQSY